MSSNRSEKRSGVLSWLFGVGVGTVFGAALGLAWVWSHRKPDQAPTRTRPRSAPSTPLTSLNRSQLPKRHFKFLISKDRKLSTEFSDYLTEIFRLADSDKDGALTEDDLQMVAVAVKNEPIGENQLDWYFETFETNAMGNLTLAGFLKSYEWPLTVDLPIEEIRRSYEEEVAYFGCTMDSWMEA